MEGKAKGRIKFRIIRNQEITCGGTVLFGDTIWIDGWLPTTTEKFTREVAMVVPLRF